MNLNHIRNFSIIAHIDHGKSTLADRLLERTGTIEQRKMKAQVLDSMELERERGITIKMQPVRMTYRQAGVEYQFNLIDTPGHIDFSYEVSRALKAVEGVILLVDATKGVQAQTVTVLDLARELNLAIIPVINKIDLPAARPLETATEISDLLGCRPEEIIQVSAKTGVGVDQLLEAVLERVPPPLSACPEVDETRRTRALVFDFEYSPHQGLIVYVRVFDGRIEKKDRLIFSVAKETFQVIDLGLFRPEKTAVASLGPGEIGYLVTGLKDPSQAKVGETINNPLQPLPIFSGYAEAKPVVWASIYPRSQDDFDSLKQALRRLRLSDASLSFAEESSNALGRGFSAGFLGLLHLEIITERLRREYDLELIVTTPSISYEVIEEKTGEKRIIAAPHLFPEPSAGVLILEPWAEATVITPTDYLGAIIKLLPPHEGVLLATTTLSAIRSRLTIELPLRELMRNFFNELKSLSSGFASLSYRVLATRPADLVKLEVLVAEEVVPALTRVVARAKLEREAGEVVDKLKELLPRQLFTVKIQARALGRILASRSIAALKKDVTGYLYGGDITRKMKLREKQKRGKKRMQSTGTVNIPHEVFIKLLGTDQ